MISSKTIEQIQKQYNLDLKKILKEIKKSKPKIVLLQFADGLKPHATTIKDHLAQHLKGTVEFLIWFGTCFGACDTPQNTNADLTIQFGHNEMMPSY